MAALYSTVLLLALPMLSRPFPFRVCRFINLAAVAFQTVKEHHSGPELSYLETKSRCPCIEDAQ